MDDLVWWPATQVLRAVADRALSPVEYLDALVAGRAVAAGDQRPRRRRPRGRAGRRTTNGSLLWADHVSARSDPLVERLQDAGGPRRDPHGVPIGAQRVRRAYDDATVFRVGAAVEADRASVLKPLRPPPLPTPD
jgi:hypothetical protein